MNKRALYESIMKNVAKEVKKALNEAKLSLCPADLYIGGESDGNDDPECDTTENYVSSIYPDDKCAGLYWIEIYNPTGVLGPNIGEDDIQELINKYIPRAKAVGLTIDDSKEGYSYESYGLFINGSEEYECVYSDDFDEERLLEECFDESDIEIIKSVFDTTGCDLVLGCYPGVPVFV